MNMLDLDPRPSIPAILSLVALACGAPEPPQPPPAGPEPVTEIGAIPITTRSDDAYDLYLEGRRLSDRLRPTEARQRYLEALEHDRHFALALLALANSSVSAREFFESMERATALADVVSRGERLMILAQDAGVRGDPVEQQEMLERLVELHPADPRAHALLGGYHWGRQEFDRAVEHYERAVELDPRFSPAHNSLGYLYRAQREYELAERAFLRYIELIPDEPNPYDSYAELLMKTGRFEESIATYRKALEIKPDFLFSLRGIGHDLIFLDRYDEAREVFRQQLDMAPDAGQRRGAHLSMATSWLHQGRYAEALDAVGRAYAVSEADGDRAAMAGDLVTLGNVLLEAGELEAAAERFVESVELMAEAGVPDDVRDATRRNSIYWLARVDLAGGRLDEAERRLEDYRDEVEARRLPFEVRRAHELAGAIALARGDAPGALRELAEASQQNPRVLYLTARAHRLAGDLEAAVDFAERAASFNGFGLAYAFVRRPARELLDELRSATAGRGRRTRHAG